MLKNTLTIFTKEFMSYFRTPTAYIIIAVYLVLSMFATFYSSNFFMNNNIGLTSFFTYQPEILIILIPALTMKLWSDERRSGTIEFILTQPISYTSIILGKFLAALAFGCLLLVLTLPFDLYVSALISLDSAMILSAYLGTILSIMFLTAIGCMISAFNTNSVLAYLFSVFMGWILISINFDFLLQPWMNLSENLSVKLTQSLNFYHHYQDMIMGEPGLDNLMYFCTLSVLALWINRIAIDYKKQ